MSESIRRRILFTGDVQGVGFRQTTCMIARQFDVTGYVRNLPDGRVEAVVEALGAEIDRFQLAVEAEMSHYIRSVATENGPTQGGFSGFAVRY